MRYCSRGATLIELVVILFVATVLAGLLIPPMGRSTICTRQGESATRVRGIHQGMVTFAYDNKGYFPGMTGDSENPFTHADDITYWDKGGAAAGSYVGARYAIMLEGNYFTPDYLVSPSESAGDVIEFDPAVAGAVYQEPTANFGQGVGPFNYSYAMLEIHGTNTEAIAPNGAAAEWRDTLNSESVVLGDRNIGKDNVAGVQSIHTETPGDWQGHVVWNDNHVTFEQSPVLDVSKYGERMYQNDGTSGIADHLFTNDDGGNDAKLNIMGGAGR